uniref:MEG 2.3 isoform 2 n=1 Tax=Schistosoma mansoni TaxID=6183 RepID=D7PD73_SCHMA|nr:MEG 2.3 isoform 2 [Schistosoma mansoni]
MCLTIFYVIHLLAIFSDGAEWVITCNKTTCCAKRNFKIELYLSQCTHKTKVTWNVIINEDGNSKICCVGNDCKDVISSGADDLNLFLRKRGMANKLGEILKNLN